MQHAYEAVLKNSHVEMVQRGCPKGGEVPRELVQSNVEPDDTTDHIYEVGRESAVLMLNQDSCNDSRSVSEKERRFIPGQPRMVTNPEPSSEENTDYPIHCSWEIETTNKQHERLSETNYKPK